MRSSNLLSLYNQVILALISEVYLYLIEINLLIDVGIHLSNMLRVQILNSTNVDICDIEDIAAGVIGLLLLSPAFIWAWSSVVHTVELLLWRPPHYLSRILVERSVAPRQGLRYLLRIELEEIRFPTNVTTNQLAGSTRSVLHRSMPCALISFRIKWSRHLLLVPTSISFRNLFKVTLGI